jgi:hypothetical protein
MKMNASNRSLALGLLMIGGIAAASRSSFVPDPRFRISRENFERITIGMHEAEVEGIFGRPPGEYVKPWEDAWAYYPPSPGFRVFPHRDAARYLGWRGDDGVVVVAISQSGTVVKKYSYWIKY